MTLRRRSLLAGTGALLAAPAVRASTPMDEFVFAGDTGLTQRFLEQHVIPNFVAKHGIRRFVYVPGPVSENLAKVRSQRANPQIDAILLAGASAFQAVDQTLVVPPDKHQIPNTAHVPAGMWPDPALVPLGLAVVGLLYNTKVFADKGFAPPTSWFDMWDERFSQHVGFMTITATSTVAMLLQTAHVPSGDAAKQDAALAKFHQIKPHMYDFFATAAQMDTALEQGDLWIGGQIIAKAITLQNAGLPIRFVAPQEGAVGYALSGGIVNGARHPDLAHAWFDHLLSRDVQEKIVAGIGYWPVAADAVVPDKLQAMLPDMRAVFIPDWRAASRALPQIVSQWNRQVEG